MFFDGKGKLCEESLINYPADSYQKLREKALQCERCQLRQGASQVVMGCGNVNNRIMFIGEGPGADEDRLGEPFVGRAGQLLDKIFAAVNIKREDIYITNIVKCRPPGNRNPVRGEVEACSPILKAELKLIDPMVIVPMGSVALKQLLAEDASITRMRGKWEKRGKYYFFPTFHPAYLLRNPGMKKKAWYDFQMIKKALDRIQELKGNGQL